MMKTTAPISSQPAPPPVAWRRGACGALSSALLALLMSAPGCARKEVAASPSIPDTPPWKWEVFPAVQRMRLATLPCQLLPKSSISIYSPMVGVLRVYATQPQTNLAANVVWGEFEPAMFKAEAEAIDQAKAKLEEREHLQLELELPKEQLRMEKEFEEARRQLALLQLLSTNKDLARAALKFAAGTENGLRPEAVTNAQTELGLLTRSLDYLRATNLAVLGIDLAGQRSEWERRKLEFERRQAQARLKMPFRGQLTINLPLTEGVEEYPVNTGQELAVARDLSLIRLRVALSNPAWAGVSPERLVAIVRLPNGSDLTATFAFQKIERVQLRDESVYYFQFPPERSAGAARLMGTDVTCELWWSLPQPARVVPKLSLVLQQPAAFQGRDWAQGVGVAWPGASVLIEGQTDLAIVLSNTAMNHARR
ncbi:MAG: hypothetical protein U1G07_08790 [Verrucomicrobiota bacterium]